MINEDSIKKTKKLLTRKEFAELAECSQSQVGVLIERKNIILTKSGLINIENEKNFAFIEKRKAMLAIKKGKVDELDNTDTDSDDSGGIPSLAQSEKRLKHLQTLKIEKEIGILHIKQQKAEGEVIPSELIPPIITQLNQAMVTELKDGMDEVLRLIAKKHGLTGADVASYRKTIIESINSTSRKAVEIAKKEVKNIVLDFSEKRGVGERS